MTTHENSNATKIRNALTKHPEMTPSRIAGALGVSVQYVYAIKNKMKWVNAKPVVVEAEAEAAVVTSDPVNHPDHYKVGGIETIDFIEAKKLSYNIGNVVKYITRADHKNNQVEDLQKAQWYLARELKRIQG